MKKITAILIILFGLISATNVLAATLDVSISNLKTEYKVGEELSFNYKIVNNTNKSVVVNYFAYVLCQSRPMPLLVMRSATLGAYGQLSAKFSDNKIGALDKIQSCLAYVQVVKPLSTRAVKPFKIKNLPEMDFSLDLTGGVNCPKNPDLFIQTTCSQEKGNLFTVGNQVLLNPVLPVSGSQVSGVLVYPNGTRQSLTLPWVLTPTQAGAYSLEVTVSKSGYLPSLQTFAFAVLAKKPNIAVDSLKATASNLKQFDTYKPSNLY